MQCYMLRKLNPIAPQFVIAEQNSRILCFAFNLYLSITINITINYCKLNLDNCASGKPLIRISVIKY